MSRRNVELLLLCLAAPMVILLFAMVMVNAGSDLTLSTVAVPIGIFLAFLIAHIAVRVFAPNADPAVLPIVFALSGIGITFIARLDTDMALRQVVWLFVSIIAMVAVLAIVRNLDKIARYKYTLMIIGVVLLLSPMLPGIGTEINGSRIWLMVGSFSFQPGELAKIFIIIFLAAYLAQNREMISVFTVRLGRFRFPDLPTLIPLFAMCAIAFVIVVFERDLGSALVVYVLFLIMIYVASGKKFYLVIGLGLAAIGAVVLYMAFGHVQTRVDNWLNPWADPDGTGYQLCQAIYSMADGGLFGVGVGNGLAENIPVVESDYIFALIAEELGLLGGAGVLLLYLALAIRGFATAARAKSDVSSFVAVGATSVIVLQAFIIVGGVTRLIPLTGLTLPFISQGGSSLLASFIEVALILRCGDEGTGLTSEIMDGTTRMTAIGAHATHGAHATQEQGVLGRVALGKRLTATMVAFALLFAALVANLTYIMVVNADEYQSYPGNNHTLYKEAQTERGSISTSDGVVLAESVQQDDGTYEREYPAGDLAAHVVGYYSTQYGTSGIEDTMNDVLQGNTSYASWQDVIEDAAGINTPGNDVELTINSEIQQTAQDELDGYSGAIVVMNPKTGAILACASSPTYDISDIEDLLAQAAEGNDDGSGRLVNRAVNALYAPGSTFKIVTLTSLLENGVADEDTTVSAPASLDIGGGEVTNAGDVGYGTITLKRATEVSSNTAFGQLGVELGADKLVATAESFGFNKELDGVGVSVTESLMPDPDDMTEWETAWAAAGQPVGEHASSPAGPQATVLQMAMVASAVANDGVIETPYFVEAVYNYKGERSYTATTTPYATVMSQDTADTINDMLVGVVNNGTGYDAEVSGVQVAGKTGTAETGKEREDSWFVGYAPADDPTVVVAVLIEEGVDADAEDESGLASPRASAVIEKALEVQGNL
jgi:cell division protein FtsI/penicillin-binding protein 2/cell division protein FtsW (lipid II flippase)